MPKSYTSVDEYIEAAEAQRRPALERFRSLIREEVPGADESIQYGMPAYEYHGMLCAFATQKQYLSFYVLNGELVDRHRHLLAGLDVGKGCIRIKPNAAIPETALRTLLAEAAAENERTPNDHC